MTTVLERVAATADMSPVDEVLVGVGLSKAYAGRPALSNVTLKLAPGQVLGLVGRNGAGKTTLIQCLLGLCKPDAGEARLWGQPSLHLSDAVKTRLSYVSQSPEAMGWMSVRGMLQFFSRFYPEWDDRFVEEALRRLRINNEPALNQLSPGQRQQATIVRALASRPHLLVLDEPASALDPVARRDLLSEIGQRAGENGCAVLFSTHLLSDLERIASHVAFLHDGVLVLHEELDALKERHLRLRIPSASAVLTPATLPGELARRRTADGGLSIVIMQPVHADVPAVATLPGVQCDRLSLEDLFVEVTA